MVNPPSGAHHGISASPFSVGSGCGRQYAGFDVVVAANADDAIVILETELDIRLVFIDIDMPGSMNGMKLAAAVRERWPPIHIIITSGKGRPGELPARALFIPKSYLGRNVVEVMRTFENMV